MYGWRGESSAHICYYDRQLGTIQEECSELLNVGLALSLILCTSLGAAGAIILRHTEKIQIFSRTFFCAIFAHL